MSINVFSLYYSILKLNYPVNMNSQKKLIAILAILFFSATVSAQQASPPELVDVAQAQKLSTQGTLLLDVREQDEYDEIHAPNATLIPLGQLSSRLAEIADYKDKPVVVVCRSGKRSLKAATMLQEIGFSHVSSVNGGMIAWDNAGLEVIKK